MRRTGGWRRASEPRTSTAASRARAPEPYRDGGAVDSRTINRVGSGNDSPGESESSTAISTRCMVSAPSAAKS